MTWPSSLTRRKPLPRGNPPQRRPIKASRKDPVTAKTRALMFERAGRRCEIRIADACLRRGGVLLGGWQYCHRCRRDCSPSHGPEAGLVGCPDDHRLIDGNFTWARKYGWRISSYDRRHPAEIPVLIPDGRRVLLTPEGGYETWREAA